MKKNAESHNTEQDWSFFITEGWLQDDSILPVKLIVPVKSSHDGTGLILSLLF